MSVIDRVLIGWLIVNALFLCFALLAPRTAKLPLDRHFG